MNPREHLIKIGQLKPSPVVYGPYDRPPLSPEAVLELRRKLIKHCILMPGRGRRSHGVGH